MSENLAYAITLDVDDLEKKSRQAVNLFRGISGEAEEGGKKMADSMGGAMKRMGAAFLSFSAAKAFVQQVVKIRGEIESLETSFKILAGTVKGSQLFEEIKEFAVSTPMEMKTLAKGAQTMLAFNIEAENVMPLLRQIGDISMGNSQKFESLTLAFSQMHSTGKLMGQDLLQMINAGFNPLAVIAEKTGKSIGDLKDEMSKGAISAEMVADAFATATSEGGKYHGMMSTMSQGVEGSMSNLKGAIEDAMNDLGEKMQGVTVKTIQGATSLVENYEKVGKVLGQLIIIYGTYKTALVTALALKKATAAFKFAKEYITMAKALGVATANQIAFNTAAMMNPYVWVAAAIAGIAGLAASIALWKKKNDEAVQSAGEAEQAINAEKEQLKKLMEVAQNEARSKEEKAEAIKTINARYGDYLENMIAETASAKELATAYDSLTASIEQKYLAQLKEQTVGEQATAHQNAESKLWGVVKNDILDGSGISQKQQGAFLATMRDWMGKYAKHQNPQQIYDKFLSEYKRYGGKNLSQFKLGDLYEAAWDFKDTQQDLARAEKAFNDFADGYTSATKKISDAGKDAETEQATTLSSIVSGIKKAKAEIAALEQKAATKGLTKDEETELSGKRGSLEGLEKRYKEFTGVEYGKQSDAVKAKLALQQSLTDAELKLAEAEVDAMEEGTAKKIASIELNRQKTNAALDKELKDLENKAKEAGTTLGQDVYDDFASRKSINDATASNERLEVEKEQAKYIAQLYGDLASIFETEEERKINAIRKRYAEQREQLDKDLKAGTITKEQHAELTSASAKAEDKEISDSWMATFGSYEQRLEALKNEWAARIKDVPAEFADEANRQMNEAIYNFMINEGNVKSVISQLFDDITEKSVKDLRTIADAGQELYDFLMGGEWDDSKGMKLGISKEEFETIRKSPTELERLRKGIKEVNDQADKSERLFKKMASGLKDIFSAGDNSTKLQKGLDKVSSAVSEATSVTNFLQSTFESLANASGNEAMQKVADGLGIATDAMGSAMEGAQAGAAFGPWGAAAGAALGLVTSLYENLSKLHDDKIQAEIENIQKDIDDLGKTYDELSAKADKAYSKERARYLKEQNDNLEKQNNLIKDQIKEEESKKNSDSSAVDEMNKQIEENNKLIEENKQAAIDAIFGEDIQSAIESFADAITDVWAEGKKASEGAKNWVKSQMRQMVSESIKSYIQASGAMERIREALSNALLDDVVTEEEKERIMRMGEQLAAEVDKKYGWADDMFSDEAGREAVKGSGIAASQESVDNLDGRMTTIQSHTYSLVEGQNELRAVTNAILDRVIGIEENTYRSVVELENININVARVKSSVDEMTTRGVKLKS